jgi:hypothetical protein
LQELLEHWPRESSGKVGLVQDEVSWGKAVPDFAARSGQPLKCAQETLKITEGAVAVVKVTEEEDSAGNAGGVVADAQRGGGDDLSQPGDFGNRDGAGFGANEEAGLGEEKAGKVEAEAKVRRVFRGEEEVVHKLPEV